VPNTSKGKMGVRVPIPTLPVPGAVTKLYVWLPRIAMERTAVESSSMLEDATLPCVNPIPVINFEPDKPPKPNPAPVSWGLG
jgi:hypothetical protein